MKTAEAFESDNTRQIPVVRAIPQNYESEVDVLVPNVQNGTFEISQSSDVLIIDKRRLAFSFAALQQSQSQHNEAVHLQKMVDLGLEQWNRAKQKIDDLNLAIITAHAKHLKLARTNKTDTSVAESLIPFPAETPHPNSMNLLTGTIAELQQELQEWENTITEISEDTQRYRSALEQ
jgi:hypothetical protein